MTTQEIAMISERALTPAECKRMKRHKRIRNAYKRVRKQFPKASNKRICDILAERYDMSVSGIRTILINQLGDEYSKHSKL